MQLAPSFYFSLQKIILLIFFFLLIYIIAYILFITYKNLKKITKDLYQYEIKNFCYTYFILSVYIFFFIFLVCYFRYLYINKPPDLKIFYIFLKKIFFEFLCLSFFLKFYVLIIVILCFFICLLIIINLQTLCFKEFFKFHIYMFFSSIFVKNYTESKKGKLYTSIINYFKDTLLFYPDIISGTVMNFFSYKTYAETKVLKIFFK